MVHLLAPERRPLSRLTKKAALTRRAGLPNACGLSLPVRDERLALLRSPGDSPCLGSRPLLRNTPEDSATVLFRVVEYNALHHTVLRPGRGEGGKFQKILTFGGRLQENSHQIGAYEVDRRRIPEQFVPCLTDSRGTRRSGRSCHLISLPLTCFGFPDIDAKIRVQTHKAESPIFGGNGGPNQKG
jgi:hypothetical protein